jgi:hypothetical protein
MKFQIISPTVHGILDYMMAAMLPFTPRLLGFGKTATHCVDAVAGTIAANEMMTRNEVGLVKAMPMKTHLLMDALTGGCLIAGAVFMDEESDLERWVIGGIGLHLITQAALTQPVAMNKPKYDDAGRSSPMQRFAEERRPSAAANPGEMHQAYSASH